MLFKEYLPHPQLRKYVECYWKFVMPPAEGANANTPQSHVFPPDGSCSLVFVNMAGFGHRSMVFVGPTTVIKEIPVFANSINLGIRLKPGCGALLSAYRAADILNSAVHYQPGDTELWQQTVLSQLELDFDNPALLDDILLARVSATNFQPDERILKAIDFIIAHSGQVALDDIAANSCISPRQLQRLFTAETGISIKQFCQLRRLRKAIIDLHIQHNSYPEMVNNRGFADQAHYYKSFKNVAGYDIRKFMGYIGQIEHVLV